MTTTTPPQPTLFAAISIGILLFVSIPFVWYMYCRLVCTAWVELSCQIQSYNVVFWMIGAISMLACSSVTFFMLFVATIFGCIDYYVKFIEPNLQKTQPPLNKTIRDLYFDIFFLSFVFNNNRWWLDYYGDHNIFHFLMWFRLVFTNVCVVDCNYTRQ